MALADPTDYGNKPGDGPLRPGGEAIADTPSRAEDLPSYKSKAAKRQESQLSLVRDLYEGQERVREAGETYLPRNPGEDPDDYRVRLQMSVYHGFFRRTAEGMIGLVFRKDPVLGEDVPPLIREDWENIDLAGTHGDVFTRDLAQDAMVAGHAGIVVDFPTTGGTQSAADEMGDIRPYWVPIKKDNILSWRIGTQGGREFLLQLVLLEKTTEPEGKFGEREVTRYRRMYWDPEAGKAGYELLQITKDKKVVPDPVNPEGTYENQTEIPFVEVPTSGRRGVLDSDPPLASVAYLDVAHYQQWSDYANAIHKTVPFLATIGLNPVDDQGQPIKRLLVGPGAWVNVADPNGDVKYVAHDGHAISDQKDALEALKADIGAHGLAMLAPQTRHAETAEAKRLDKATSDSALAVSARALQDAIERALLMHARYRRLPAGGSIKINRDFEGLLMDADVMRAYADLIKAGFPEWLAVEMLKQGGRIPEDADPQEVALEWAAGKAAADEAHRQDLMAEQEALEEGLAA